MAVIGYIAGDKGRTVFLFLTLVYGSTVGGPPKCGFVFYRVGGGSKT